MEQESASLESARYDLSKVRIESPIKGIVTRRNIEEGETVVIGTMNNAGTVLLTIADMSVINAEIEVDETDIPSCRLASSRRLRSTRCPNKTFTGKVVEIGNSPIQTTGTRPRRVAGDELQGEGQGSTTRSPEVRPGFTCTAEVTTADPHARSRSRSRRPPSARW